MGFIKVASSNEIEPGRGKTVEVNGKTIAILNDNGKFYAIDDTCAHAGGSLGDGNCGSGIVTCPLHGWEYGLENGKNTFDSDVQLNVYDLKVEGEDIYVDIDKDVK